MFSQYLLKTQRFDDEHMRRMVEVALSCVFFASNISEMSEQVVGLLDSLVVHFTLISLAHYNNQDLDKIGAKLDLTVFSQSATCAAEPAGSPPSATTFGGCKKGASVSALNTNAINQFHLMQHTNCLDFMILIDVIYLVLSNDDMDYWMAVQRSIMIMIETSEIVSGGVNLNHNCNDLSNDEANGSNQQQLLRSDLANIALFDYLAEKLSNLCYERSWYAKKAG